jgi:hypothetical protein
MFIYFFPVFVSIRRSVEWKHNHLGCGRFAVGRTGLHCTGSLCSQLATHNDNVTCSIPGRIILSHLYNGRVNG